jgi:hypothetical protein
VTLLSLAGIAPAQQSPSVSPPKAPPPPLLQELQLNSSVETQFSGDTFWRVKCDPKGNLYVRKHTNQMVIEHTLLHSPVQKISPDGNVVTVFNVDNAMSNLWGATDFVVAPDETVYQIAATSEPEPKYYILKFHGDGSLDTKIELQVEAFQPYQLAVFKTGELLVSGTVSGTEPFIAIFDGSGKLIRRLNEPQEAPPKPQAETRGSEANAPPNVNLPVAMGEAVTGSDGNVYLMRASSPPWIYGISKSGEIVKKFRVGSEDSSLVPVIIRPAEGKLLVVFRKKDASETVFRVVDLDGNDLEAFRLSDKRAKATTFACWAPPAFAFFDAGGGRTAVIQKAE